MKSIIVIIVSIAFSINAFSQRLEKTYWDIRKTKIQSEYYTDAYGTKNGSYKGYSQYGGILLQGTYKDNAPIGKWTENYLDGKLHYIKIYTSPGYTNFDVNDGKIIAYYEDGKTIQYERNFKNHELDGEIKEYSSNGTLTKEGIYVNGVFERTGESKRLYDEEQEKLKQKRIEQEAATLIKNTEEYNNIIPEADKAFLSGDFNKALKLYKSASERLVNEQYPKDRISEILEKFHTSTKFFNDYLLTQKDSLASDFKALKSDFKLKSVKEYNKYTYTYDEKRPASATYDCNCLAPWNERYADNALKCFQLNKEFYEPYQRAITEAYFKYEEALKKEETNVKQTSETFYFLNTNNQYYTYEKNIFLNNLKGAKDNFELSKTVKSIYLKGVENKANIKGLNDQNKKKVLFKKYMMVNEDLTSRINAYPGLSETISLLKSLNSLSDRVIELYSKETKELESKLKDAETSEQIQAIILGQ